jgi:rod shape-determining protein MreD
VTPAASPARKAITAVILAVALFAAVVLQFSVVNRLPLPGAPATGWVGPDLVLLLVAAIAVCVSPAAAAVTGFAGGLALDIAPPATHYAGEYALVFCLAGYGAAGAVQFTWNRSGERDPVTVFAVMAAAAGAGEAGKAALGLLLSDPNVTGAVVSRVLPAAVLYDLILAPLVFWPVARLTAAAARDRAGEGALAPGLGLGRPLAPVLSRTALGRPGLGQGVFRPASAGAPPGLRLAGTGGNYAGPSPARRVPRLRLSGTSAVTRPRTNAASTPGAPLSLAGGRAPRLNLAADRPRRPAGLPSGKRTPGKNWLGAAASPALPAARRAVRSPSRGWLTPARRGGLSGPAFRGPVFSSPAFRSLLFRSPVFKRAPLPGSAFTGSGRSAVAAGPARSPDDALAARSAPSGLSALSGAGTPLAGRRSPQPGWLRTSRGSSALRRQHSPRRGWLGGASRPRTVIGSGLPGHGGAFRRGRGSRGNWYAAAPSGAWLRRRRHPWRKRLHLPLGRLPLPRGHLTGGRPLVPRSFVPGQGAPGARAAAEGAARPPARKPRLFGLTGGRR